jgi:thiol-disulfide isomerase/thioredoxin
MRKLLVAIVVGLVSVTGGAGNPKPAQDQKEPPPNEKLVPSLKVGDSAPTLNASKWLQGEEVRKFEPGKVSVVEFWATWCGPCIWMMSHTAELQAQYKDQDVTIIGFTARDLLGVPNNTEEKVAAFVKKRGPKLKYTFAYADDSTTSDAWMKAAGRDGIPCAFVVDKAGRIAYIGSPAYLGVALPKVIAGDAPQAVSNEVGKIEEAFNRTCLVEAFGDDKASLQAFVDFEAKYPSMGHSPMFARGKLFHLATAGDVGAAREFAEAMTAKAIQQDDPKALSLVSAALRWGALHRGQGRGSKELLAVAVKAAEARAKVAGDQDAQALIDLADTYGGIGDKAKAREYARKAGEVAGDKEERDLIDLAKAYCAIGDKAKAREYVRKAGEVAGDKDVGDLVYLAENSCAIGDNADARDYARKAGLLVGDKPALLINLANAYFALGDKAEAREYARKAVAAATGDYAALKPYIEQAARRFDDEKKEDNK